MKYKALYFAAAVVLFIFACSAQAQGSCPGGDTFIDVFNAQAAALNIKGGDGQLCMMEEDHDDHHDDGEGEHEDEHKDEHEDDHENEHEGDHENEVSTNCTSCDSVSKLVREVILKLNLTTAECLDHAHNDTPTDPSRVSDLEAYGYGFLMVVLVSLASLIGIVIVPMTYSKSPLGRQIYEFTYAFMIALAISALVSDAILHLIPHVFNLHGHEETATDHNHGSAEEEEENQEYIWKSCVVLLGTYGFFLFELLIHTITHRLTKNAAEKNGEDSKTEEVEEEANNQSPKICDLSCRRIKPVAWLVIVGDSVHNFADGLAIGAAISQSISLAIGTTLAVLFHEVPHELGDYAILIQAGIHWLTALLFNFLSSLTAVVGMFIGVAISQQTEAANEWILAITAGLFLYIGLTDLLPDLIHETDAKLTTHGWRWWLRFFLVNLGFLTSFAVLLLLAVYEDKINDLVT